MPHPALPPAEWQYPTCGACYADTDTDGDDYYTCYPCGLTFSTSDLTAEYLDDTAEPCGHPCDNTWHATGAIKPGWTYLCTTCQLPAGHRSRHWTNCTCEKAE